ncbi:MAG: helix-turn-helix domain-containing protein [Nocardioides sp.]
MWTGAEAKRLRQALRLTIEGFAEKLGVNRRTVDKWEANGETLTPRPDMQAMLDTMLGRAKTGERERFWRGFHAHGLVRTALVADSGEEIVEPDPGVAPSALSRAGSCHLGDTHHAWRVARGEADLQDVIELSRRTIGGQAGFAPLTAPPPTTRDAAPLQDRLNRRADAVELCLRRHLDQDGETLVGYLMMYPLDETATGQILAGEVTGAEQIRPTAIAATHGDEFSLYIAMVLGADISSRSAVMERCINRVSRWSAAHPAGRILARRATSDGQRWMKRYGFLPIGDDHGVWLRDAETPRQTWHARRLKSAVG